MNVLVAGAGYVGAVLAAELAARGDRVHALRRRPAPPPPGCTGLTLDCSDARALDALPPDLDAAALLLAPDTPDDAGYERAYVIATRNLVRALSPRARRLVFTSSTAVYAQRHGEWVDEESPAEPGDFRGRWLLEGEAAVREAAGEGVVLRLGGIYGPGRTALLARLAGEAEADPGAAPHFANRIHRDDAAGAVAHLLRLPRPAPCYLGVDCEPADERTLRAWLAAQPPERLRALRERAPAPAARRRAGSKRCSNARLLASGYRFRYPTFREGYGALLDGET